MIPKSDIETISRLAKLGANIPEGTDMLAVKFTRDDRLNPFVIGHNWPHGLSPERAKTTLGAMGAAVHASEWTVYIPQQTKFTEKLLSMGKVFGVRGYKYGLSHYLIKGRVK